LDETLWESIPAYHEVKVLLPDGRVVVQREQLECWKWKGEVERGNKDGKH
jgi:hypothetical protein